MAQGVLPFIRGIDLSRNCFENDKHFPDRVSDMASLRWLRLNRTNLSRLPDQLSKLQKLEHLSIAHNELHHLHDGDLHTLPRLRVVNARNNHIKDPGIPPELFDLEELTTVDFGRNQLEKIPEGLENAKGLLVLSLSRNRIKEIPKTVICDGSQHVVDIQLFQECTDIQHLDVSDNELTSIPPQLRRCRDMDTLILSNNPLINYKLRSLQGLSNLRTLNLRNTERNLNNVPEQLDTWLTFLEDLDISYNSLPQIPPCFYRMEKLKRLDASHNSLTELSSVMESWTDLELLNVAYNKLQALPAQLTKCTKLKRIFLSFNELTFDGIPTGISRLVHLEQFIAASNKLECIPESLCRCTHLQRLVLHSNSLLQLPEGIHMLKNLKELDVRHNPNLVMPPKPEEGQMGSGEQLYNIDFDIDKLKQGAVVSETEAKPTLSSRKARIFKRRVEREANDENTQKVLKGLSGIAEEKTKKELERAISGDIPEPPPPPDIPLPGKKWRQQLEKPNLNYSDIFERGIGQQPGLTVWLIDNFLPVEVDSAVHSHLFTGDAYIVLKTFMDESEALNWDIFFWIGSDASLDKKACAAIHAVHLRNMLGAECRILREEQGEESHEFTTVFDGDISYVGGGTVSGFYTVEDEVYASRLYRVSVVEHSQLHLEAVDVNIHSLDPRFVFLLDVGKKLYVWPGPKSSLMAKTKTRLFAETMNKNERKNKAEVTTVIPGDEPDAFWDEFGGRATLEEIQPHVEDVAIRQPHLYRVGLGHGYLELPQVEVHFDMLTPSILNTSDVYILDCFADVFVWIGRKSPRLVRVAALKLSQELCTMLDRPSNAIVTRTQEGSEVQVFKSKFKGWDNVLAVDFTKSPASLSKGKQQKDTAKVDLSALFTERQAEMSDEKSKQYMQMCNDDLREMTCFVLDGKKLSKLPDDEIGVFFSGNCYVFVCNYKAARDDNDEEGENEEEDDQSDTVVYFWEGREAPKTGWVTFKFSFQKKMEERKPDLQVFRMCQQQETLRFLAHFGGCIAIQRGKRRPAVLDSDDETKAQPQLFQFRTNSGLLCMRMVEVDAEATSLNSKFCHILKVPFDNRSMGNGVVYVWSGSKCSKTHVNLAEEMAKRLFEDYFSIQSIREGKEPTNFFWVGLRGQKEYSTSAYYLSYTRLFRCSNERGFFAVSEKTSDFCQDDLANDDVMILDNGQEVFLWVGPGSSEIERKLAAKSAQVYVKYWTKEQTDHPRTLSVVHKGKEPVDFKKCFHGWGPFSRVLY